MSDDGKIINFSDFLKCKGVDISVNSEELKKKSKSKKSPNVLQSIVGDNNSQTIVTTKKYTQKLNAIQGTIGANPSLKDTINTLIYNILDERVKLHKSDFKDARGILNKQIKSYFKFPKTVRWDIHISNMPESFAVDYFIPYLQSLYDKTIGGKLKKSKNKNANHIREYCMKYETEALSKINLNYDCIQVRQLMQALFNVRSHLELDIAQLNHFLIIIQNKVEACLAGKLMIENFGNIQEPL